MNGYERIVVEKANEAIEELLSSDIHITAEVRNVLWDAQLKLGRILKPLEDAWYVPGGGNSESSN